MTRLASYLGLLWIAAACGESLGPEGEGSRPVEADRPKVAAGSFHSCFLDEEGYALCWGHENDIFDTQGRTWIDTLWLRPRPVGDAPRLARLDVGGVGCGLTSSGEAYCWGRNGFGELGDGTTESRLSADRVLSDVTFHQISVGLTSVCALEISGVAHCWGNNFRGQLGIGQGLQIGYSPLPLRVAGGESFRLIDSGASAHCGLTASDKLYCWGGGFRSGAFPNNSDRPVEISTPVPFDQVAVGESALCGLSNGVAYCTGWNGNGILGTGDTEAASGFVKVSTELRFRELTMFKHACGIAVDNAAYCWGSGKAGQLGNASTENQALPSLVEGGHRFEQASTLGDHTCAMSLMHAVFCWGWGQNGRLGSGTTESSTVPRMVDISG